jgi:hypothetical protein
VPTALLENRDTGENVYLVRGQRWKRVEVLTVTNDEVVLRGPQNVVRSVSIVPRDANVPAEKPVTAVSPAAPITGPIGNISVQPLPLPQNPSQNPNQPERPRRRRGGNNVPN